MYPGQQEGVFQNSGLVQISLPSTLCRVAPNIFSNCKRLQAVYYQPSMNYNIWNCVQNYALVNESQMERSTFEQRVNNTIRNMWA